MGRCSECGTEGVWLVEGRCALCAEEATPDERIAEVAARLADAGVLDDVRTVAAALRMDLDDVLGRSRLARNARGRHAAWRALSELGLSSVAIGRIWGVHHTSVLLARGTLAKARLARARRVA
jgi:hypothetical protein